MIQKYIFIISFLVAAVLLSTCKKDYDLPTGNNKVELASITTDSVSYFSVKIQSRLNNTGGNTISDYGLCWSLDPNPDITKYHKSNGYIAAPVNISASFQNLLPGKKYYIRSYATIPTGTVYGLQSEFTTLKTGLPVSLTDTITDITYTSAVCKGLVVADSGLMVTRRGICWSLTPNPLVADNADTIGKGLGAYEIKIDALNPGLTYYIRAFAVNDSGTSYGVQKSFLTVALTPPVLTTTQVKNIGTTTTESGGNITSDGGSPVTSRGVCWGILPVPTISNSNTNDGAGIGSFNSVLSNLTPNTPYYVRAYATNALGTSYGEQLSFNTIPIVIPTITTSDIINITINTAGSGGNITSDGGGSITRRGVCWSVNPNPTTANNSTNDGTASGIYTSDITGLINNTTYYVRAYATNSAGTAYGNELSFKTIAEITIPTVTTTMATAIASNKATSGGNVTSTGGASVIVRGICYGTIVNPTIDSDHTTDGSGSGIFISNLTGLIPTTTYHIRAYATNSAGTAYGDDLTFTTTVITAPVVTTAEITAITTTTSVSGGNVTSDGGTNVTARGVCWSTSTNPTSAGSHTSDGTGTGTFISNLTGLNSSTTYYLRAYATNSIGTSYGSQLSFTTLTSAVIPTVSTTAVTGITATTATSGGNVTSSGGATVTARGVCWSTSSSPTTAAAHTNDGGGTGSFVSAITSLSPSTFYYIRAYATNSIGVAYGNELTFTTTSAITLPTVTTTTVTNITSATATSGGNITSDGGATVTVRGVCWSINQNPSLTDSHTTDGTGTGTFISTITGLTASTTYYVRAYATNSVGTAYGNQQSFTTFVCGNNLSHGYILGITPSSSASFSDRTYSTIQATWIGIGGDKCWTKMNLGATEEATSSTDSDANRAGWYFQFNRQQGYFHDGLQVTPSWTITNIDENSDWTISTDPCRLIFGGSWRIPSKSEIENFRIASTSSGGMGSGGLNNAFNSSLKLHAAGVLGGSGSLSWRGTNGYYFSNLQYNNGFAWFLTIGSTLSFFDYSNKTNGMPIRCIKDN